MLNFCPKCRNFYSDADLRFCLKDGVPLIAAGESENLRREGEEFINRKQHRISREIFRKQIRKLISITITTILTILVISVLTINSWLYLNPETPETAKNETIQPAPQPSIEISVETVPTESEPSPDTTPTGETSPVPNTTPNVEITITPTPTIPETPTTDPETPSVPPSTPKVDTPTPTPKIIDSSPSTPTPTPAFDSCSQEIMVQMISQIRNQYGGRWREETFSQKQAVQNEIAAANNLSSEEIFVKLNFSPEKISVSIFPGCHRAFVRIQDPWTANSMATGVAIRIPPLRRAPPPTYNCEKVGSSWSCK